MEDSSVLETTKKCLVERDLASLLSCLLSLYVPAMGFVQRGKGVGNGFGVFLGFFFLSPFLAVAKAFGYF